MLWLSVNRSYQLATTLHKRDMPSILIYTDIFNNMPDHTDFSTKQEIVLHADSHIDFVIRKKIHCHLL